MEGELTVTESLEAVEDVGDLVVLVTVAILDFLEEVLVFFNSLLLTLDALALLAQDFKLSSLHLNLDVLLRILLLQILNTGSAVFHDFHVAVEVASVRYELLGELGLLGAQIVFAGLEFHLGLRVLSLLSDVSLLIIVHLSAFVQQASGGTHRLKLSCIRQNRVVLLHIAI